MINPSTICDPKNGMPTNVKATMKEMAMRT